ncbi:MAG: response regulator transcription factor [Ahniella sp.]|nr:response regulator transcription factor [Ahniella sp.]
MNYRVAIIDDDGGVRHHIADLLAESERYRLAWTAPDLKAARAMLSQPFDVLLLDLGLPDGRGTELMPLLRAPGRACVVIAFTVFDDEANVIEAIESGVDGYALKTADRQVLFDTLDSATRGENPISPAVAGYLFKNLRRAERAAAAQPVHVATELGPMQLTPRERDVLEALARGVSYREAADALGMSINTLSHHVKNLYPKLAATSRSEAIYHAVREGIIRLDS